MSARPENSPYCCAHCQKTLPLALSFYCTFHPSYDYTQPSHPLLDTYPTCGYNVGDSRGQSENSMSFLMVLGESSIHSGNGACVLSDAGGMCGLPPAESSPLLSDRGIGVRRGLGGFPLSGGLRLRRWCYPLEPLIHQIVVHDLRRMLHRARPRPRNEHQVPQSRERLPAQKYRKWWTQLTECQAHALLYAKYPPRLHHVRCGIPQRITQLCWSPRP
jgi:hypothetical protein